MESVTENVIGKLKNSKKARERRKREPVFVLFSWIMVGASSAGAVSGGVDLFNSKQENLIDYVIDGGMVVGSIVVLAFALGYLFTKPKRFTKRRRENIEWQEEPEEEIIRLP